jgi:O-antigen/teichoic acid export membrane protein
MTPIDSILRNSTILAAAKILSSAIGLGLVVLLPRLLGTVEFGRLYLAISLTAMFGAFANLGLAQVVTREVARDRAHTRDYLRRTTILALAFGIGLYAVLPVAVSLIGYPDHIVHLVLILGLGMIVDAWSQMLGSLFSAHERMLVPAVARIAINAVTIGVLLGLRHVSGPSTVAVAVAVVMVLATVVSLVIQGVGVRYLEGFRRKAAPLELPWRSLVRAGFPFLAWQVLGLFYFRIAVIMLGRMTSDATVGWYGAASRLLDGLTFIPDILMTATFPVVARLWTTSPAEFQAASRKTLDLLLTATVPIVVTLCVLAYDIVDFLFTIRDFGPSVPILRINALTLGALFVDYYLATILMAVGRERKWLAVSAGACVLNPVLNWVLIPLTDARYGNGGVGAAVATLVTEVFVLGCALRLVPRGTFDRRSAQVALRAGGAGAVSAGVLLAGLAVGLPWMAVGVVGGIVYLILAIRWGLLPVEVLRRVRGAFVWGASTEVV